MSSNVEIYRAKVAELISQADITTVSAKGIRRKIETLTNSSLDHVKREFDELVMEIYEKITDDIERAVLNGNGPTTQQPQLNHGQSQQQQQPQKIAVPPSQPRPAQMSMPTPIQTPAPSFGLALPPTSYVAPKIEVKEEKPHVPSKPPKSSAVNGKKRPVKKEESDDESDASISSVEDESPRSKKARKSSSPAAKKKSSSKKSKDKEKGDKPKRKPALNPDGTPKTNAFTRPLIISNDLASVVGSAGTVGASGQIEMSRPEVVKQIWVYIKANNLQSEGDKRVINCDSKLKNLFGLEQVNCFSMNKYLSAHLTKPEEAPSAAATT
ncbi:upstream activation factor subunit UAF30 [Entomortierella parvispora]|uniref:Upstream activation factor subunit UAF30 n=1 Tax=Entomortierella parvispora TaxID=205924 RepID=A0A9P3HGD2_9FUNG|nr:upstream activation factor subunit UAF30 [Entomortierella parvispora]